MQVLAIKALRVTTVQKWTRQIHLHVIQESLEASVRYRTAAQRQRAHVSLCQRETAR